MLQPMSGATGDAARVSARRHPTPGIQMGYSREDVRDAVRRAGEEHWRRLVEHHEDAYPASPPTPGEVCRQEAERLNGMGLGDAGDWELVESRVEASGSQVSVQHVLRYGPLDLRLLTEPHVGYGG